MSPRVVSATIVLLLFACTATCQTACAAGGDPAPLDFSEWEALPVFYRGRIMPLDTFARDAARTICGRESPKLMPEAASKGIFPDGEPRKFTAAELLFSWLVQPGAWERVPVLHAEYIELREDVLSLKLVDEKGRRLRFVSPHQLDRSPGFPAELRETARRQMLAQRRGSPFEPSGLEKSARELEEARRLYRQLTFDPAADFSKGQGQFSRAFARMLGVWWQLESDLSQWQQISEQADQQQLAAETKEAMEALGNVLPGEKSSKFSRHDLEPSLARFRRATAALAEQIGSLNKAKRRSAPNDSVSLDQHNRMLKWISRLAWKTGRLATFAREAHLALYDNGRSIRIVPSLNPYALEVYRDAEDNAQPWLSIEAILFGTPQVLDGYPWARIEEIRRHFEQTKAAYLDRDDPQRAKRFAAAMKQFAAAVRVLAEEIEPLRKNLPLQQRDEEMMEVTAYPSAEYTDVEMNYNRSNPFLWAWVVSLVSVAGFSLSFGVMRKPMFWVGVLLLGAAEAVIVYGFCLRVMITGYSPVTNMFETMAFAALCVGLLGLWLSLLPLCWPGLSLAWRLTAFPFTWEERPLSGTDAELIGPGKARLWSVAMTVPRLAVMGAVFWALVIVQYGEGKPQAVISLLPQTCMGSSIPSADAMLIWVTGVCVLGCSMWYLARAAVAVTLSLAIVPFSLSRRSLAEPLRQVMSRKSFVLAGALLTFMASVLAFFSPILNKEVGWGMQPVLRNNFWLALHVLSITAAYAPGALAWTLSNLSLGYYLFGNYRDVSRPGKPPVRRGPEACTTLAGYAYKAMQVSVLLLVAGTILGGLWADVSWGRFWSWDPKEVWSLIAILVFMVVLHGRYARWVGDFGFAVGAVLALMAIAFAWYGVSYLMPDAGGRHSYGGGNAGGQFWVIGAMVLNVWFVVAAAFRYGAETWGSRFGRS